MIKQKGTYPFEKYQSVCDECLEVVYENRNHKIKETKAIKKLLGLQ